MLWVCLLFPQLPLHSGASAQVEDIQPRVLFAGSARHPQVACVNAAARQLGVRRGQSLAAARVLCPQLLVDARNEQAEQHALTTLADWAGRFSSQVAMHAPGCLFIEIGASLRLFGDWPTLESRLRGELLQLGHAHRLAVAPCASGARVLAGWRDGLVAPSTAQLVKALAPVGLHRSGLDAAKVRDLHNMGLRTLGELFRLPRPELSRRAGSETLLRLDRMRGLVGEALVMHRPQARFERRLEFEDAIEHVPALSFPLSRLIRELENLLLARNGSVQHFELQLHHHEHSPTQTCSHSHNTVRAEPVEAQRFGDSSSTLRQAQGSERTARFKQCCKPTRLRVGLLTPQQDGAALLEYARGRLESLTLPQAVTALSLIADDLPPLRPACADLFDTGTHVTLPWPALAERLRTRLGDTALQRLVVVADHRPGRAWRFEPWQHSHHERTPDHPHLPRPFWLLPRPAPLPSPPARMLSGPERIESGWWDEHDQRRDYYRVETSNGQQAWVFCKAGTREGWMLHGWFA